MCRENTSTITMAATLTNSQMTWFNARSGARRVTKAMPMPDSTNTMGRMAGSASGARNRMEMCAMMNAPNMPMGTPSVFRPRCSPWFSASMMNIKMTMGAPTQSKINSRLRLVIRRSPLLLLRQPSWLPGRLPSSSGSFAWL